MPRAISRLSDHSERATILIACVVTCALAASHAIWKAAGHRTNAVDPRRLALCFLLIIVAYWAGFGFYLVQWHGLPRNAPPRRLTFSPKYRAALHSAGVAHVVVLFFAGITLMAGLDRICYGMIGGYWVGVLLIIFRRPLRPAAGDLEYIRFGLPIFFFGFLVLIELLVWVHSA